MKEQPLQRYTALLSELAGSRQVLLVSLVLLVITVILYSPTLPDDYDMWWHLRYGEHYVKGHTWTIDDGSFSWTPTHHQWIYGTWVGSALVYSIHTCAGISGLLCFRWVANLSVFIFFLIFLRRFGEKLSIIHIAAFALVAAAFKLCGTYLKPERASDIFFAALIFIYFMGKSGRNRLFLLFPPLFLLWVNVHGAFVTGLLFIAVAAAGETCAYLSGRLLKDRSRTAALPAKGLITLLLSAVLSFLVIVANPTGLEYPMSIVQQYTTQGSAADLAVQRLWAWTSMWGHLIPDPQSYKLYFTVTAWAVFIMGILFIAVWITLLLRRRCGDPAVLLLNVVFFLFAMSLCRATLYYPALWLFSFFYLLSERWLCSQSSEPSPGQSPKPSHPARRGKAPEPSPGPSPVPSPAPSHSSRRIISPEGLRSSPSGPSRPHLAAASLSTHPIPSIVSLFLLYLFLGIMLHIGLGYTLATDWQGKLDSDFVPRQASQFVRDYRLPAPVFNDYLTGGYLMWSLYPEYKVFVDPRQFPYMKEVLPDYFAFRDRLSEDSLERLQDKYPFRTAIIHHLQEPAMVALFMRSPRFRMVYFDECAAVFVDIRDYAMLSEIARTIDLSPSRFKDIRNTDILISLFSIYRERDINGARQILAYYESNVTSLYKPKGKIVRWMHRIVDTTH